MKNIIILIAAMICSVCAYSQAGYRASRNNGVNGTTEDYVILSPGNMPGNSFTTARTKDSTFREWLLPELYFRKLPNLTDSGGAINFLYTNSVGKIMSSSLARIYPDTINTIATISRVNTLFYTKAQSDARYLQGPEVDPTVASYIKAITATNISEWGQAYEWGNHAGLYVPLARTISVNGTVQPLSSNQVWSIYPDSNVFATRYQVDTMRTRINVSLAGKEPTITAGTAGQYWAGNKTWQPFPAIPAQVNITGGDNTKVSGLFPNIVVADSFTTRAYSLTGTRLSNSLKIAYGTVAPSTSNGYSIDISGVGFAGVLSVNVMAIRNAASASTSPNVSIKSMSNTAVVVNVTEDNPATVSILGIAILSGLPSVFANVTGLTLNVTVIGY